MSSVTGQSTAPVSPHANWSTAPLIPRKSPERRRLALGHKTTQSLNLPRLLSSDLKSSASRLDDNVHLERSVKERTEATYSASDAKADLGSKALERLQTPPITNDPFIVSPRPRRSAADVRALENVQVLADNVLKENPLLQPSNVTPEKSLDTVRWSRAELQTTPGMISRGHVRNARSLSPVRHGQMQSEFSMTTYEQEEYLGGRPRWQNLSPSAKQGLNDEMQQIRTRLNAVDKKDQLTPRPLEQAIPSTARDYVSTSAFSTPVPIHKAQRSVASCISDEEFEHKLISTKDKEQESERQLDWAVDVLRLCERKAGRQYHRSAGISNVINGPLNDLQHEAILIVQKQAKELGSARAMFVYGTLLETGREDVPRDRPAALKLYKEASWFGYGRADYRLGVQFEKLGDIKKACEAYERGAGADDSACLYRMGMIMYMGQHGYDRDESQGLNCIHLSALGADSDAPQGSYVWALLLAGEATFALSNTIVKHDHSEAVKYLEKAASLGLAIAQFRLGKAHEFNELGCEFNPALSWHYYKLAADGDNPDGDMAISKWSLAGSEDGAVVKDERKAFYHAALAAGKGLASAEFAMGYFYEVGIACDQDIKRAQAFYRRAANHGSEEAKSRIEGLARSGTLSRQDHEHHVSTRIIARHATIKSNQRQDVHRHGRGVSNMIRNGVDPASPASVPSTDTTKAYSPTILRADLSEKESAARTSSPIVTNSETMVRNLDIAQRPVMSPIMPSSTESNTATSKELAGANDISDKLSRALRSAKLEQDAGQSHRRGQSWMPPSAKWSSNDIREAGSVDLRTRSDMDTFLLHDQSTNADQQHNRVHVWNQENVPHSGLGSPNLAPSELGSILDGPSLPSPRPESSVSNIQPFQLLDQMTHKSHVLSSQSDAALPLSGFSSGIAASSASSISHGSSRRAGPTTFEEMGIPLANKKKEECIMM